MESDHVAAHEKRFCGAKRIASFQPRFTKAFSQPARISSRKTRKGKNSPILFIRYIENSVQFEDGP